METHVALKLFFFSGGNELWEYFRKVRLPFKVVTIKWPGASRCDVDWV